jgi:hypothetical protein
MKNLLEDGVLKALKGLTTLDEVLSICHHADPEEDLTKKKEDPKTEGSADAQKAGASPGKSAGQAKPGGHTAPQKAPAKH